MSSGAPEVIDETGQSSGLGPDGWRRAWQRLAGTGSPVPSTGREAVPTGVVLIAGVIIVLIWGQQYTGSVFILSACYAIVAAGMAVQIGFSQQIAFSQSVFMGGGAYGVAMLNTHFGMSVLAATPLVMIGAGIAAYLLGSVVTRVSGLALAVATLMLPLIAVGYVSSASYLGGAVGQPLTGTLWPGENSAAIEVGGGLVVVVFLAIVVFVSTRILRSDIGLELFVLGADEPTAAAMGVRTSRRRLELFVLGSVFAALGGAAYAGTEQFVPETLVSSTAELALLIMLFIGGRRSIIGALVGALVIQYLQGASNWVSVNILVVEGGLLTIVLLINAEGLAGIARSAVSWLTGPSRPGLPRLLAALVLPFPVVLAMRAMAALSKHRPAPAPAPAAGLDELSVLADLAGPLPAPASPLPPAAGGTGAPMLRVTGVTKEFGGLSALADVSIELPERGLFGLCGPNGAGKSTLLNVIGGNAQPTRGHVHLDGADITRTLPYQRFRAGISRTFQAVHLISGRTVLDNVAVSCLSSTRASIISRVGWSRLGDARGRARTALEQLGMAGLAGREVSALTLETQRMVELARAMAPGPRLLLLDEPASGLSVEQRRRLATTLTAVAQRTCVLLVEHDLDLVAEVCERIYVLSEGRLIFDGGPEDFRASPVVNSLLIGQ